MEVLLLLQHVTTTTQALDNTMHDADNTMHEADCDCIQSAANKAAKKPRRNINVHSAYLHVLGPNIRLIRALVVRIYDE
jgi:Co/Zn/Cd efflux system component